MCNAFIRNCKTESGLAKYFDQLALFTNYFEPQPFLNEARGIEIIKLDDICG